MAVPNIDQQAAAAFQANVRQISQQQGSKLRAFTDSWSPSAVNGHWDVLGAGEASDKTRDTASSGNETGRQYYRRVAIATPSNDHELIESHDPSLMLSDPKSKIVTSLGMSMGRSMDSKILAAAVGNATTVTRTAASEPEHAASALPASQIVGDGTTPITFDMITEIMEKFNQADVDESLEKIAVIGPRQIRELLNLTEVTSSDYVNREQLQKMSGVGVAAGYFGWTWIMSTRLPIPATGERSCVFMTRDAIGFNIPQDVWTMCERDSSRQYAWRPYAEYTGGAVRIEDAKVVRAHVADATAP